MDHSDAHLALNSLGLAKPKRSLRKKASDAWRSSIASPIYDLFHHNAHTSEQAASETSPNFESLPVFFNATPRPSLKPTKSFFGSLRAATYRSPPDQAMMSDSIATSEKQQASPSTPHKSLRAKLRRSFSRPLMKFRHASSSPIDIPTIKKDIHPLQKPIPLELASEEDNPLLLKMLHSPGLECSTPSSVADSACLSPLMLKRDPRSPMPGTTFSLDVIDGSSVPFEEAYDKMTKRDPASKVDGVKVVGFNPKVPSRSYSHENRPFSVAGDDPFIDSPKKKPVFKVLQERNPAKTNAHYRHYGFSEPGSRSCPIKSSLNFNQNVLLVPKKRSSSNSPPKHRTAFEDKATVKNYAGDLRRVRRYEDQNMIPNLYQDSHQEDIAVESASDENTEWNASSDTVCRRSTPMPCGCGHSSRSSTDSSSLLSTTAIEIHLKNR